MFPPALVAADAEANRAQRLFLSLTAAQIVVALASGVAGVIAIASDGLDWLGIAASAGFPVITILRIVQRATKADARWFSCRAAAESMKSLVWRYAVGVNPFSLDESETDVLFHEKLRAIVTSTGPSFPVALGDREITPSMSALRAAPRPIRSAAYERNRLMEQLQWYEGRAHRFQLIASRADRWFLVLSAVAIAAGVVGLKNKLARGVVGMSGAVIGVILGWVGARGYGGLARSYAGTARDLAAVHVRIEGVRFDEDLSRVIEEAELIIDRERSQWRAARL